LFFFNAGASSKKESRAAHYFRSLVFLPQPPLVTQVLWKETCAGSGVDLAVRGKQKSPLTLSIWHLFFSQLLSLARLYFFIAVHNWRKRAIK
jgi:hypothetical protein